jgi:hypothetical protein
MPDAIDVKYAKVGGKNALGEPVGTRQKVTRAEKGDGTSSHTDRPPQELVGELQHYQKGLITQRAEEAAFAVYGPIFPKLSWSPSGGFGWPIADSAEITVETKVLGFTSRFEHKAAFLIADKESVVELDYDAIYAKWWKLGGPAGDLKFPVTGKQDAAGQKGSFVDFQNGSIFSSHAGVHEVHGLNRKLWRERHAEADPRTGFPISDESTIPGTSNRYNDFENGVITWQRGAVASTLLAPLNIKASGVTFPVPASQVLSQIDSFVRTLIKSVALPSKVNRIELKTPPIFRILDLNPSPDGNVGPVTQYAAAGDRPINRRHRVRTVLLLVTDVPNAEVTLDLDILVAFDRSRGKHGAVVVSIYQWWYLVSAGFPIDADLVGCKFEAIMKPLVGSPIIEKDVPDAFAGATILSVKTQADGSIDLFAV